MSNVRKIVISIGVVGAAAAVAGMGTFGSFTSTTSGSQSVAAGTVKIDLGANGGGDTVYNMVASNVVPGDKIQRVTALANSGTADLAGVTLTTTAVPSSRLDTETVKGLQLNIDSCSKPWTQIGTSAAPAYQCTGIPGVTLASKPVIGKDTPITTAAKTPGTTDYLRLTLTMPEATTDPALQGLTSTINMSLTATQRTAGAR